VENLAERHFVIKIAKKQNKTIKTMGKTKELAMRLTAENFEELSFAQDFSKKEAKKQGTDLANEILNNGNSNPLEVMATLVRLSEVINTFQTELKANLDLPEELKLNGVNFKSRQGYAVYDYSQDGMVDHYEKLLKQRKDLIKSACKAGEPVTDPNTGEEINPVPVKNYTKDSIVITF
jgi:vacuolar-type H+-ATPase subunit H